MTIRKILADYEHMQKLMVKFRDIKISLVNSISHMLLHVVTSLEGLVSYLSSPVNILYTLAPTTRELKIMIIVF